MLYSGNMIGRLINIDDSYENLVKNLTLKSCEVEEVKKRQLPDELVVGKTTKVEKHPDADKLYVCQVDCGEHGKFQIITGGENIVSNRFVAVALPGCYLSHIDLKIGERKMRGLDSAGMICSKEELGINEDTDKHWIWLLDEDILVEQSDIGKPLKNVATYLENAIIDVENKTLTNRPDLTGHFGLSTEIFAIYPKNKLRYSKINSYMEDFSNINVFEMLENTKPLEKEIISETSGLRSYILMSIDNINVEQSDFYTRLNLLDLGLTPKNNWVDFSNLFLFFTGQPIHFFDADKVKGNIRIKDAKDGEEFEDLFGEKHTLNSNDLVIADDEKILALAGVMGSNNSCVDENTKNILVEIANFDNVRVRKTGTRLGLRTDAQIRYEKNINPLFSLYASIIFLEELKFFYKTLGDYQIGGTNFYADQFTRSLYTKTIDIDISNIEKFVFGKEADLQGDIKNTLEGLGFVFVGNNTIKVPVRRSPEDINIKEDVVEEFARIYGYDNIKEIPLSWDLENVEFTQEVNLQRKIEDVFSKDYDFDQIETYPWINEDILDVFGVDKSQLVELENPIDYQQRYLRSDMLGSMVSSVAKNFREFDFIKIYDTGKVWYKTSDSVVEQKRLSFALYKRSIDGWQEDLSLLAKSYVRGFIGSMGIDLNIDYQPTDKSYFHPKKQGKIFLGDEEIGYIGVLHPIYYENFKFFENSQICYVELCLEKISSIVEAFDKKIGKSYYETLQDQIVFRDVSFVVDKDFQYGKIIEQINKVEGIEDVDVFDIYFGENLPENKKSISLTLKIRGKGDSSSDEINKHMREAIENVKSVGGEVRE
ncbi:phenylalanine--tRNA ligase subunit beta [Candidatus Absconditicoccus praedator]|uniref:phenylalanine--tRNA ligase subunit beta n=1 Tax=Candidatus Absconditicoccus praedator TaxID=2735562 RepID=UPI001E3C9CE5|nr:phenylalanine--tRNA ligase subunit beta [Candidatus Absconditicoccus praedator]UFX82637.1 phenylalanine--tRNA ligase subunit beta [Candidatus Absconditicoccus praedator]